MCDVGYINKLNNQQLVALGQCAVKMVPENDVIIDVDYASFLSRADPVWSWGPTSSDMPDTWFAFFFLLLLLLLLLL